MTKSQISFHDRRAMGGTERVSDTRNFNFKPKSSSISLLTVAKIHEYRSLVSHAESNERAHAPADKRSPLDTNTHTLTFSAEPTHEEDELPLAAAIAAALACRDFSCARRRTL